MHDPAIALAGLDLNLLVALDAQLHAPTVTAAARHAGVTQSAMSHTLRRLRVALQDPLLVRSGEAMVATPRAESLRGPLRDALLALHQVLHPDRFEPATSTRTFRIAGPDLFSMLVLPRLLPRLEQDAPGVDVVVVPGGSPDALRRGDVDLVIAPDAVWAGPTDRPTELLQRKILEDDYACFVRVGHPLARAATVATYVAANHVVVSPTGRGGSPIDDALAREGLQRRIAVRVPGFAEAAALVPRTELVLTAPRSLARWVDPGRMSIVAPPLAVPRQSVSMRWHARLRGDAGLAWFRDQIAAAADG
jgi:DNA-binding transcriptional LysR family regulator